MSRINRRMFLKSAGVATLGALLGKRLMVPAEEADDWAGAFNDGLDDERTYSNAGNWSDLESFDPGDESTILFWGENPPSHDESDESVRIPDADYVRGYSIRVEDNCLVLQHGYQEYWYNSRLARAVFQGDELVHTAITWDGDDFELFLNGKSQTPIRQMKVG